MVKMVMATVMAVILVVGLVMKKLVDTRRRMATMRMRRTSTMLLITMTTTISTRTSR